MNHHMGLYEEPMEAIKSGNKKIEVRLNDEKRRKISVGDTITFTKVPEETEQIKVEVTAMVSYSSFHEMYSNFPASDLGAEGKTIEEMVKSTYHIYTPEQEKKWGTLAIQVKLIQ
ncbi:hypothetical protein CEY16_10460 [Halalkalibacillus sediminis]|uniref:ASCH domain-containing protein n=1 Tax=Halalkalibacillus sediminis TaxID=2018042 RepID=A0A2I0QS42_9BACI|nr:ASCH domain-containing protein [Halalkalibacillus sediminis]PKR77157.1 hypothetical protein CEY16_10460 [Halalkalibacillus sediminis]